MKPTENRPKPGSESGRGMSRAFVMIIAAPPVLLLLFGVMLLFKSCDLLGVSIFPDYLPAVEARIKLTDTAPEFKALDYVREDYSINPRLLRNGAGEEYLFVFLEPHVPGVQPVMVAYSADLQHAATYRAADFGGTAPTPGFLTVDFAGSFALGLGNPTANLFVITDVRNKLMSSFGAPQSLWHRPAYSSAGFTLAFSPGFESTPDSNLNSGRYNIWGVAPTVGGPWMIDGSNSFQVFNVVFNSDRTGEEVALLLFRSDNRFFTLFLPNSGVQSGVLSAPINSFYRMQYIVEANNIDRSRISLTKDGVAWYDEKNQEQILLKPDGSRLNRPSDMRDVKFAYHEPSGAYGFYVMRRTPEVFKIRSWWR